MDVRKSNRRPGDLILDRYMLDASDAEREAARENLRAYAAVILRIATRLAREEHEAAIRAKSGDAVAFEGSLAPPL